MALLWTAEELGRARLAKIKEELRKIREEIRKLRRWSSRHEGRLAAELHGLEQRFRRLVGQFRELARQMAKVAAALRRREESQRQQQPQAAEARPAGYAPLRLSLRARNRAHRLELVKSSGSAAAGVDGDLRCRVRAAAADLCASLVLLTRGGGGHSGRRNADPLPLSVQLLLVELPVDQWPQVLILAMLGVRRLIRGAGSRTRVVNRPRLCRRLRMLADITGWYGEDLPTVLTADSV